MRPTPEAPAFYPFETGELAAPAAGDRVLVLGAVSAERPPFPASFTLVQGFRPLFLKLDAAGLKPVPEPVGEGYDLGLIVAGRHRGQNELWLAEAILRTKPDALIVMAGGKTDGISSLRKRLAKELPIDGHLAKNHGEVFWLRRSHGASAYASLLRNQSAPLVDGRFQTAPGMFSHDRVDAGSRLLAGNLPPGLAGLAADFCAGWGYLSAEMAERCPGIESIALYEADHASLKAARANTTSLAPAMPASFHWTDLAVEPVERRYDLIVMNPPFHQGRAAEPGIGHAMIRAASKALKAGGQLFMVANRGLPYEPVLKAGFSRVEQLADEDGFKVWRARR